MQHVTRDGEPDVSIAAAPLRDREAAQLRELVRTRGLRPVAVGIGCGVRAVERACAGLPILALYRQAVRTYLHEVAP